MSQCRARDTGSGMVRLLKGTLIASPLLLVFLILSLAPTRAALLAPADPTPFPDPNSHTAPATTTVSIAYGEAISAATVSTHTFAVHAMQTGLLTQSYNVQGGTITLTPAQPLKPGELVQVSATTGTLNLSAQGPVTPTVWQFRAAAGVAQGGFADTGQLLGSSSSEAVALGDLDGDGDLDAFVANSGVQPNKVWLNQGGIQGSLPGIFTDSGQNLGNSNSRDVALGDVDGDGDLDAFVANEGQGNRVWLNDGGAFTDSGQSLSDSSSVAVALGDVDGDGDLDALVANSTPGQPNKVWLNNGGAQGGTPGVFTDSGQHPGEGNNYDVALGDLDGDGDLDVFITSDPGGSEVWLKDGSAFVDSGQYLDGDVRSAAVDLGDVDDDGDLDAFVTNWGYADKVWINNGAGIFTDSGQSLSSANGTAVILGDLDGDGDLDALVANAFQDSKVWLNDGGIFTDSGNELGNSWGFALGDLDDDGDLDAFFAQGNGEPNRVWLNRNSFRVTRVSPANAALDVAPNATVSATLDLPLDFTGVNTRTFSVRGNQTGVHPGTYTSGLLRFESTQDFKPGEEIAVNLSSGIRSTTGIALTAYTWSFRAAAGVAQGIFADSGQLLGNSSSQGVALGDLDGDGDVDAFVANGDAQPNRVWLNNGGIQGGTQGVFDGGQNLGNSNTRAVALGDLDGDGDLDAFVANDGQGNKIWLNHTGTFTDSGQSLSDSSSAAVELGDLDGDGDLDAVVANCAPGTPNKVWFNNGGAQGGIPGAFTDSGQSLSSGSNYDVALGDLDGDGDLDAFITSDSGGSEVWLNGGLGVFSDSGQSLDGAVSIYAIELGDLDGDGDLDAFVTYSNLADKVWLNNGVGIFTDSGQSLSTATSPVVLGDLDGDGDLDALAADKVWLNAGGIQGGTQGVFTNTGQSLDSSDYALGDLDGDGDVDAFVINHGQPNTVWLNEDASGEPDITLNPSLSGAILNPDDAATRKLTLGNTGTTSLIWNLSESPAAPWLSATPDSGSIAPGSSRELLLTLDASGLADGVYATTLQVNSNDPDQPQVDVSLTLTVTSDCIPPNGASISFEPLTPVVDDQVSFSGSVWAGTKPLAYSWDFGDGSAAQSGNPIAHSYTSSGAFTVTVTASNACGTDSAQRTLAVNQAPASDFEPNDTCATARSVPSDGVSQAHSFSQESDQDWAVFDASAGTTYLIETHSSVDSSADVSLEIFDQCDGVPDAGQSHDFSPDVRLEFQAPTNGPLYLKLTNEDSAVFGDDVDYLLSVRALSDNPTPGALVLVAGKLTDDDPLQDNIHHVTDQVFKMFLAHDYTTDRVTYLATDPNLDGYDDAATAENLEHAITSWALGKVATDRPLTLYMMDHGGYDKFYLDKPNEHWVRPEQIDAWLTQLQAAVPGLKVNVIVDACYSGSFIDLDQSLSGPDRVVIASTGAWNRAWASDQGAVFSDHFIAELNQGASLYAGFQSANWAVQASHPSQTPWLDDTGNGVANESADGQEAARRGFAFAGTLGSELWPPYIVQASGPATIQDGEGVIRAQVRDDEGVLQVWAVIYPPSYQPPDPGEEMEEDFQPTIVLQRSTQDPNLYAATYPGFDEAGVYHVVVHAYDIDGLEGQPKVIQIGWQVYLPLVIRR